MGVGAGGGGGRRQRERSTAANPQPTISGCALLADTAKVLRRAPKQSSYRPLLLAPSTNQALGMHPIPLKESPSNPKTHTTQASSCYPPYRPSPLHPTQKKQRQKAHHDADGCPTDVGPGRRVVHVSRVQAPVLLINSCGALATRMGAADDSSRGGVGASAGAGDVSGREGRPLPPAAAVVAPSPAGQRSGVQLVYHVGRCRAGAGRQGACTHSREAQGGALGRRHSCSYRQDAQDASRHCQTAAAAAAANAPPEALHVGRPFLFLSQRL